jgi:hypothetical protein
VADLIDPSPMQRIADRGETIVQEFVTNIVPNGSLTATIVGDPIITLRQLVGSRDGPREEFTDEELSQLPPALRKGAKENGFRPDVEFGRVGPGVALPVRHGDRVKGTIECVVPATQPFGAVFATLRVDGFGGPVEVPFTLSVGRVQLELLVNPVVAQRGQSVQLPIRITLPPGAPAARLAFELRGDHCRIIPAQFIDVPEGGTVIGNLTLVTDLDAPLGLLPENVMSVVGFDGAFEHTVIFDITVAEPSKVTAKLNRPPQDPPRGRAFRGGRIRCEVEFAADPGFASSVLFSAAPGMPAGVHLDAPVTAEIVNGTLAHPVLRVDLQARPVTDVPTGLLWRTFDGTSSGRLDFLVTVDERAVRRNLAVTVRLAELHCVDEGDGPGTAEPYLWPLFFKVDGETVSVGPGSMLQGQVFIQRVRSPGHGNLGSRDVDAGDVIAIPEDVGRWNTTMVPIPIADEKVRMESESTSGEEDVAGSLGVLLLLMEEDSLPDGAALAGYNSMVRTFEVEMNKVIPTLGVTKRELSPEDELVIKNKVRAAVQHAIVHVMDFPTKVAVWIAGPDDLLGSVAWQWKHDELSMRGTVNEVQRWKEGFSNNIDLDPAAALSLLEAGPGKLLTSGGEWILKASVTAT